MRRRLFISLIALVAFSSMAFSEGRSFSLNAGLTFDNYGYLNQGKTVSTEYAGFRITPDWCFAQHWGMKLDLGAGWAFYSNAPGQWQKPLHSMCNLNFAFTPYYEFNVNNWFVDLGPEVGVRARLSYMNTVSADYLKTLTVGVGLDFRFGYMFNDRWGIFAECNALYSVFDPVIKGAYSADKLMTGNINAAIGVKCNLYRY